jgi:carboxyl-terminal processing protease
MRIFKKSLAGFLLAVFIMVTFMPVPVQAEEGDILDEVREIVKNNYVDPVSDYVLAGDTVDEILKRLGDSYASYLSQETYEKQMEYLDGHFSGIGIYISMVAEGVEVVAVIEGSPAEKAGLKPGDIILAAGEQSLSNLKEEQAQNILRGPNGSEVQLRVKRGTQVLSINAVREDVEVPTVHSELLDKHTVYLGVDNFGQRTAEEMENVIIDMQKQEADKWIADFRGNPGGYLESAVDMAGLFMGKSAVVIVKERAMNDLYIASPGSAKMEGPAVLLLDEYSASAAEILAAAIQDNQRAILLGKTSYGKGTVQEIFPLSNGDKLKITVARFYSPLGHEINGVGVKPDIEVENENCLAAARLILSDVPANAHNRAILIDLDRFIVEVDSAIARRGSYWKAWGNIIDSIGDRPTYCVKDNKWSLLGDEEKMAKWPLYYPGYELMEDYELAPETNAINLYLSGSPNERYVNASNIELVRVKTGERIAMEFKIGEEGLVTCHPVKNLEQGEYWLTIKDRLRLANGEKLPRGQIAAISVK